MISRGRLGQVEYLRQLDCLGSQRLGFCQGFWHCHSTDSFVVTRGATLIAEIINHKS
jgi:hypothetical protein